MSARRWRGLPRLSRCALMTGGASVLYLLLPDHQHVLRIAVQVLVCATGVLAFEEVWRFGGRMQPLPGLSQAERLFLRTAETASVLAAVLIVMRLL